MKKSLRNSSKAISSAIAVEETTPVETIETAPVVSDATPVEVIAVVEESTPAIATPLVARDPLGFGVNTSTSWLAAQLIEGKSTRPAMLANFLAKFADGTDGDIRAKKTTFSVFLSDVKSPIGKYHASRALVINSDATGILSVDSASLDKASAAIAGGILTRIKGTSFKNKPTAFAKLVAEFGY